MSETNTKPRGERRGQLRYYLRAAWREPWGRKWHRLWVARWFWSCGRLGPAPVAYSADYWSALSPESNPEGQ